MKIFGTLTFCEIKFLIINLNQIDLCSEYQMIISFAALQEFNKR